MNNKQLKKQFWGAQDEALQHTNSKNRLFYSKIIEHKKIEYSNDLSSRKLDRITFSYEPNVGIANFKINGDWRKANLYIDGSVIDVIDKITDENSFDVLNNGSCIPILSQHKMEIVSYGSEYMIEYDIVSLEKYDENKMLSYFIKYNQYETDSAYTFPEKYVSFNHPVEKLTLITSEPIEKLVLNINDEWNINFNQISPLKWEINFGEKYPPNFSRIDRAKLNYENNNENNIIFIYAQCHNMIRFYKGLSGFAFSA